MRLPEQLAVLSARVVVALGSFTFLSAPITSLLTVWNGVVNEAAHDTEPERGRRAVELRVKGRQLLWRALFKKTRDF